MKKVRKFTAGTPARGTETTSIQHATLNSAYGAGYRGVFFQGSLVSFTTEYHKRYSFSKRVRVVHRYVPRQVGQVVVYFIGPAQPFVDDVQDSHYNAPEPAPFIWEPPPEPNQEPRQSQGDASETNVAMLIGPVVRSGVVTRAMTRASVRRAAAIVARRFHLPILMGIGRLFISVTCSGSVPSRTWVFVSGPARGAIGNPATVEGSKQAPAPESSYAGAAVGNSRRILLPTLSTVNCARAPTLGLGSMSSTIMTTSRWTTRGRYSLATRCKPKSPNTAVREASVDSHRIHHFASALEDSRVGKPAVREYKKQANLRLSALSRVDLKAAFRALTRQPNAEFRIVQEEVLGAVVQRQLCVLVVMATRMRKSLLFMLPASLSHGGLTVVIAPLNALRDNLQDRCEALTISCADWNGKRLSHDATVHLHVEGAVSAAFGRFLNQKRMSRQLERIVIDECHVLMDSSEPWRPDVLKLTEMTDKDTGGLHDYDLTTHTPAPPKI
ncbi:hypothetical protein HBH98_182860 [Parastagonospora nodorum]|nr:hypothetical protein HBH98_182860 [Parastagonospora nodorum]KAH5395998.1 hypothetical protein HBI47_228560 [Parastagonospora nodorum]